MVTFCYVLTATNAANLNNNGNLNNNSVTNSNCVVPITPAGFSLYGLCIRWMIRKA